MRTARLATQVDGTPSLADRGMVTDGLSPELIEGIARLQVERDEALVKLGGRRVRAHFYNGKTRVGRLEAAVHVAGGLLFVDERNHSVRYATTRLMRVGHYNEVDSYEVPVILWMEAMP